MRGKRLRKITLYEAVYYHRKLWDILARTGTTKWNINNSELMRFYKMIEESSFISFRDLESSCFACEYASTHKRKCSSSCQHCFLDWGFPECYNDSSLYTKFCNSIEEEDRKMYARMIRDLPLRSKYIGPYKNSEKRFIERGGVLLV